MKTNRLITLFLFLSVLFVGQSNAFNGFTVYLKGTTVGIWGWGATHSSLWRAEIVKSAVTTRTQLFAGPALYPSISPDGQWIAFVKQISGTTGKLCVMPAAGGAVTELTDCNSECGIDFAANDRIYFTKGRVDTYDSRYIQRINRTGGTITKVDSLNWGCCQFLISNDGTRATIRTANNVLADHAMLLHYDMTSRTGRVITQGCAVGMSSDGIYSMVSWQDHWGYDIRNWATGAIVSSFTDSAMLMWPPNSAPTSRYTQHNFWISSFATNSPKWMCIALDNSTCPFYLVNWKDRQCIPVTAGQSGVFAAGDLWVGDTTAPSLKLSTDTLAIECPLAGPVPAAKLMQITNGNTVGTLAGASTSIQYINGSNWLTVERTGSGNTQALAHTVSLTGLSGQIYKAVVTVTDPNADPATVKYTVKFKVAVPQVFTTFIMTPAVDTISTGELVRFSTTAADQYQAAYANPPLVYTISGGQSIDSISGIFIGGSTQGGPYTVIVRATIGGITKRDTSTVFVKAPIGYVTRMLSLRNDAIIQGPTSLRIAGKTISELVNMNLLGKPDSLVRPVAGDTATVGGFLYTWSIVERSDGIWTPDPRNSDCVSFYSVNIVSPVVQNVKIFYSTNESIKMYVNGKGFEIGYTNAETSLPTQTLQQGNNFILLKVAMYAGGSSVKFKITDLSGNPISNLVYRYDNSPVKTLPLTSSNYKVGDKITINWTGDRSIITNTMRVDFSSDLGRTWSMISGAMAFTDAQFFNGNVGTFLWTVTDSVTTTGGQKVSTFSNKCLIRVIAPYDVNTPYSQSQQFTVSSTSGTIPGAVPARFLADPVTYTTVSGQTYLRVRLSGRYSIAITDIAGRRLWSGEGFDTHSFGLNEICSTPGLKLVRIKTVNSGEVIVRKIVNR